MHETQRFRLSSGVRFHCIQQSPQQLPKFLAILTSKPKGYPPRLCYMAMDEEWKLLLDDLKVGMTAADMALRLHLSAEELDPFLRILYMNEFLVHEEEKGSRFAAQTRVGSVMALSLTSNCNLRCSYCYASAGHRPVETLDEEVGYRAIDYFLQQKSGRSSHVRLNFLGGGEPTTEFPLMIKFHRHFTSYAQDLNMRPQTGLVTNGNFSEEVLRWLIEERIGVTFSLDGPAAIHDALRPRADGRGSYSFAIANLRRLAQEGNRVGIRSTITPDNLQCITEMLQLAKDSGADFVNLQECHGTTKRPQHEEEIPSSEWVDSLIRAFYTGIELGIYLKVGSLRSFMAGNGYFCGGDRDHLYFGVTPGGLISACSEVNTLEDPGAFRFIYGHIDRSRTLRFDEENIQKLSEKPRDSEGCNNCFVEPNCAGGCPLRLLLADSPGLGQQDSYCKKTRALNERIIIGLLLDEFRASSYLQPHRGVLGTGLTPRAVFVSFNPPTIRPHRLNSSLEERLLFPQVKPNSTPGFILSKA